MTILMFLFNLSKSLKSVLKYVLISLKASTYSKLLRGSDEPVSNQGWVGVVQGDRTGSHFHQQIR